MIKICVLTILFIWGCISAPPEVCAEMKEREWEDMSRGIADTDLRSLAISPEKPEIVYAASKKSMYKSADRGKAWSEILSFRGTGNLIHVIAIHPVMPDRLYAGTAEGLYESADAGESWTRTFRSIGDTDSAVFSIAFDLTDNTSIFIGTGSGMYHSVMQDKVWEREGDFPFQGAVYCIAVDSSDPHVMYASTHNRLYRRPGREGAWKQVYTAGFTPADDNALHMIGETDIDNNMLGKGLNEGIISGPLIKAIAVDRADRKHVYLAASEGLIITEDSGASWKKAGTSGLRSSQLRHIIIDPAHNGILYAATGRGVFRYEMKADRWEEQYRGITTSDIHRLAFSLQAGNAPAALWAATRRGIYRSASSESDALQPGHDSGSGPVDAGTVMSMFAEEPSIDEIRAAAIAYAEVQPEKIEQWRKAAAHRAWLPSVRFSYDKGKDWQSSYSYYKVDGEYTKYDDITDDRDEGWVVSLTWELGDLIWNNDQTSIDTRSRLMVQLRDDVLNEVTRLYFERRRLQIECALTPPADAGVKIEQELRLQELTAHIDALTGAHLSRQAQKGIGAQGRH
jgi:photosystem II stability/assembly factor-like uncharacterized protein